MKHVQTDKYTIAWFKIAECISRGEKERALGVYRLLSHSFNDDALSKQLEADIYLSCNEFDQAISLYKQSCDLYGKVKRFFESAAIAEHLVLLRPDDSLLRLNLLDCYIALGSFTKINFYFHQLVSGQAPRALILTSLEKALDFFLSEGQEKNLEDFFILIDAWGDGLYEHAYNYIKK